MINKEDPQTINQNAANELETMLKSDLREAVKYASMGKFPGLDDTGAGLFKIVKLMNTEYRQPDKRGRANRYKWMFWLKFI